MKGFHKAALLQGLLRILKPNKLETTKKPFKIKGDLVFTETKGSACSVTLCNKDNFFSLLFSV